jgi:hypothetical protein
MDEYLKLEIKNHPAISSEYVKFLASHASFKDVQGLKKTEEGIDKKIIALDKDMKKLNELMKGKL